VSTNPKTFYRRNLPHFQRLGAPHFFSFDTHKRWVLPYKARDIIMESLLYLDGAKTQVHAAVVMPEHAHLICSFLVASNGEPYAMAEVMQAIKGFSAHQINRELGRKGPVWQDEGFDHVLRREEKLDSRIEYLKQNPVRRGLVDRPELYPWLWAEDMVDWSDATEPVARWKRRG
jgi:REP element-mobilizing transposase RayT